MAPSRRLNELARRCVTAIEHLEGPLVVALSGGADSAVLGWALRDRARAVHVHHGWPHSDRLESAAVACASHIGIPLEVVRVDATGPGSPEAVARIARYRALSEAAAGSFVLTAHTADDQAETVLGNLAWGSGLDGARGIDPEHDAALRPFLGLRRAELRELATLLELPYVDDPANEAVRFRRVRIRRALASLEASIAPGVTDRLTAFAHSTRDDVDFLEGAADAIAVERHDTAVRIATGSLVTSHPAVAARAVRRALRELNDGHAGTADDVALVLAVAEGAGPVELSGGHRVERSAAHVTIGLSSLTEHPGSELALVDGVRTGDFSWRVEHGSGRPPAYPLTRWMQVFDTSALVDASIRVADRGDRIALVDGHKSVHDALAEAGVPAPDRARWPVLTVDGAPVWIPGARRAPVGWVSEPAGRYVVVSAEREGRWKPVEY